MDAMYPHAILGNTSKEANQSSMKKKKKKTKSKSLKSDRHVDAVLGLSWNRIAKHVLASGSADTTVKLWDLNTQACVQDYRHHQDKVAAVQFHPSEASILLTAGYDPAVVLLDARTPDTVNRWPLSSDVECMRWDPHQTTGFLVSLENGNVHYFDGRQTKDPLFTLAAHSTAVSAMDINPFIPGMMVTGADDKSIKLWDIQSGKPTLICSRDFGVGKVFTASFCLDSPYHVAIGGSKGDLIVWNVTEKRAVRDVFEGRESHVGVVRMNGKGALPEDVLVEQDLDGELSEEEGSGDDGELEQVLQEMSGVVLRE